jgi:hypothetical protein
MSYSPHEFSLIDNLKVYRFEISSSVGNYFVCNVEPERSESRLVPLYLITHYNSIGTWSSTPTFNLGFTAPSYSDFETSGTLDLSSRAVNNMTVTQFNTANLIYGAASGSSSIYFRWNTTNTPPATLTASCILVCTETQASY